MTDALPTVELTPPDIAPYRHGNTGVDYVTTLTADEPGPHVALLALMHGNEVAGAIALDALFRMGLRPRRGRLTLAFGNVAAYRSFDARAPYSSRAIDEDMNRVWSPARLDGIETSMELQRARQLRPVLESAEILLDLHSMTGDTAPLTLCGRTRRGQALAKALGYPAWIVADGGHAAGPRLIDYGPFAEPDGSRPDGDRTAILIECGQHWRQETAVVALESCLRLLLILDMVDADLVRPRLRQRDEPQRVVEVTEAVTAGSDSFRFADNFIGLEILPKAGSLVGWDGDRAIRTPYDQCVLIMPVRRPKLGQTAVRLGRIVG